MLTQDQVALALPPALKTAATQSFVDRINNIVADPMVAEHVRDNFISYASVLKDGKFKIEDYLNAVTYVSFKLMELSNKEAWCHTFPQRHAVLVAKGASEKELSAHVSAYHKNKLVNLLMEQTLTPHWILNQHLYQKALNTQAELMATASSEKVRCDAANSILTHLAKPKEGKLELDVTLKESSGMAEMKSALAALAEQQRTMLEGGMSTPKEIASAKLIEGTSVRVD